MNIKTCQKLVDDLKATDPKIKILVESLSSFNGGTSHGTDGSNVRREDISIECRECSDAGIEGNARAMMLNDPIELVLCSNRIKSRNDVREVLIHELIHAFDYSQGRYNMHNCFGLASSEIRANREAECESRSSILAQFPVFQKVCTMHHAGKATSNIFPNSSNSLPMLHPCVRSAIDSAFDDKVPFQ